ncbi:MFS transporter [Thalassococcus sp. S3]|uniref:MFS transporter n=1 Tax=Thalassococcus sp. S3 TaxID=2017482 RepID=UPI00102447DA|nr:MFS transporter [Thalassococcus sp. S3]QBF32252.1 MFS transporter [Thalassococcus sp. S3]
MTGKQASQASTAAPVFHEGFCKAEARRYVLIATILASSLGFIDGSVVAIAMPAIRASLDATLAQAQWVHNAYMLTLAALVLVGGALGDRFGLARVFSFGIGLFVAASVLCALAPDPTFLIITRAIQGVGAAIMVPGSLAIIARAYPRAERGRAIGIWAAASALTTALGPIIGGFALSVGGDAMWRWIFAVNLPLGALALYLLTSKVEKDRSHPDTPIDLPGAVLATGGLLCIAWGLTHAQEGHASSLGLWLGGGTALIVAFLLVEARSAHPMMPLSLFRSRDFSVVNLLCFTLYSALNIILFFLPMTVIAAWGISPFAASAAFAPLSIFISVLSARMGRLADRYGTALLLGTGSAIVTLGYVALLFAVRAQMFWDGVLPAMCLVGLGMSMVVAPLSTAVMAAVDEDQSGIASGVNNAITRLAGLVSVAAIGGLVAGVYAANGGTESFGVIADASGHEEAINAGFVAICGVAAGLSAISAAIAFGLLGRWPQTAPS